MALEIVKETALKLKKLHSEFDQNKDKIKGKAKEKTTKAYEKAKELGSKAVGKKDEARALFLKKKKEIYSQYKTRMQYMKDYRQTTPYMKLLDKSSFVLGVLMTIMFAYFMGRWPHTRFYTAYTICIPLLILIRFVDYKKKGWHYYLTDFCYFGGLIVLLFISVYPKNMLMYRAAFMFANGALASATAAFSNALIFHKFDHLISLVTHPVPLVCMWNIRQITMEEQKNLPEDQ